TRRPALTLFPYTTLFRSRRARPTPPRECENRRDRTDGPSRFRRCTHARGLRWIPRARGRVEGPGDGIPGDRGSRGWHPSYRAGDERSERGATRPDRHRALPIHARLWDDDHRSEERVRTPDRG